MTSDGKGKIIKLSNAKTLFVSIPSAVATDSAFPFETGDQVKIVIESENKRLIIEKIDN